GELKSLKNIIIAALLIALRIEAAKFFIPLPIMGTQHIYITFLITALGATIYGPVVSGIAGGIIDIIGAVLFPKGAFFIGYTLTSVVGSLLYGIFFYRARLSISRMFFCKFAVDFSCNVVLNSLWPAILMNKGFFALMLLRIPKNVVMLPVETFLLYLFFTLLAPILRREKLIHYSPFEGHIPWFSKKFKAPMGEAPAINMSLESASESALENEETKQS
ncbi:MAG: folate family ECF transporter S component, partial [Oscillospiraceae bacterium]